MLKISGFGSVFKVLIETFIPQTNCVAQTYIKVPDWLSYWEVSIRNNNEIIIVTFIFAKR